MEYTYDTVRHEVEEYEPALELNEIFPDAMRRGTRLSLSVVFLVSVLVLLLYIFSDISLSMILEGEGGTFPSLVGGVSFISLAGLLFLFSIEVFFNSHYYHGLETVLPEHKLAGKIPKVTFAAAVVLFFIERQSAGDVTRGFLLHPAGREIIFRAGAEEEKMSTFLASDRRFFQLSDLRFGNDTIGVDDVARAVFRIDEGLRSTLFSDSVNEKDFMGAAEWINRREERVRERTRFWGRDNLGRLPPIGSDWSYGRAYTLEKFTRKAYEIPEYATVDIESPRGEKSVRSIESVLARARESNVILVGDDTSSLLYVIARLAKEISQGVILPQLADRGVQVFDGGGMIAALREKTDFEAVFIKSLNEGIKAGNIILVILSFPAFIESARAIGSNVLALMEPYLTSRSLQVIALSDNDSYYRVLESNPTIAQRFEKVELDESSADSVTRVLADQANYLEAREHVFFTYPALRTIAEGALRYFPSGVMPDKAIDLMLEIAPFVRQKGERVVEKEDVNELIQSKTGIAVGEVKEEEKEKLMTLEVELHRRVVGQNEAIKAIANALRRSRAGVGNPLRPLGSFLFLGPTGVGKTETAKALAHVFFGGEDSMIRIDMTEYQSEDALDKLIGSFESGRAGVLATYLKEKPYGVLLLDEFEKSNPQVLDLFLQVLDEGVFSDMAGHRINARNVIIIATSNAGAQRIWEYFKAGENPSAHKDELIDHLISRSLFKPELINRFDAVVVYEPHAEESLKKIALLMLERLKKRLAERGVAFAISDDVIEYVVRKGYDPKFGARPMNRVIQEDIEEVIARKLITGEIKEGGTFSLSSSDFLGPQGESERIPEQRNNETGQNIASGMNL